MVERNDLPRNTFDLQYVRTELIPFVLTEIQVTHQMYCGFKGLPPETTTGSSLMFSKSEAFPQILQYVSDRDQKTSTIVAEPTEVLHMARSGRASASQRSRVCG
jgi:hypothetical protein